jgi:hypothetical protein
MPPGYIHESRPGAVAPLHAEVVQAGDAVWQRAQRRGMHVPLQRRVHRPRLRRRRWHGAPGGGWFPTGLITLTGQPGEPSPVLGLLLVGAAMVLCVPALTASLSKVRPASPWH